MTRYSTHLRSRGHVANHERVPSGGSLTYGLALTVLFTIGVGFAWAQNEASQTEATPGNASAEAGAVAEPAEQVEAAEAAEFSALVEVASQSVVAVQLRAGDFTSEPGPIYGAVVPSVGNTEAHGWVVVPFSNMIQGSEVGPDDAQLREWGQRTFDGATVEGRNWSGTVRFVDCQPLLGLVLLQLDEANRDRAAIRLNKAPKAVGQAAVVHHSGERHAGRLNVEYPHDTYPWRITLDDEGILAHGAAITTANGQLLGLVGHSKLEENDGPQPRIAVVIPAEYADAIVRIQHPGMNDELDTLVIGMAMGKERAQVDALGEGVEEADARTLQNEEPARSRQIPEGMRVIAISVNDAEVISGMLLPGDRVDVLVTYQRRASDGRFKARTATLLKYVEVFDTENKTVSDGATQQQRAKTRVVSLLLNPEQANITLLAQSKGTLGLSWRHPDDDEDVQGSNVDDKLLAELRGLSANEDDVRSIARELKVFQLQHVTPDAVWSVLVRLFGDRFAFSKVESQRLVIVDASADILKTVESLIEVLDGELFPVDPEEEARSRVPGLSVKPGNVVHDPRDPGTNLKLVVSPTSAIKIIHLQHIGAASAAIAIAPLFDEIHKVGSSMAYIDASFIPVPSRRILICRAEPDVLAKIAELIKVLDVPDVGGDTNPEVGKRDAAEAEAYLASKSPTQHGSALEESTGEEFDSAARELPQNYIQRRFELKHVSPRNLIAILEGVRQRPGAEWLEMDFNVDQDWINVRGSAETLRTVEQLIAALDTRHAGSVLRRPRRAVSDVAPSNRTIGNLRDAYAEHDIRARQQAATLQKLAESGDQHDAQKLQHVELSKAVAEAFDARQNLQRAELDALEAKVAAMRRTLQARDRIKEQIIQRRVQELLNPALEWETSGGAKPATRKTGSATTVTHDWPVPYTTTVGPSKDTETGAAAPTSVAERLYQGRTESEWQRLFEAEAEPTTRLDAAIALIQLASPLSAEEYAKRIIDIGGDLVDVEYRDDALEFAFQGFPPLRWATPSISKERNSAYLRFHESFMRRVGAVPAAVLADRLGLALTEGTNAEAAFAFHVFARGGHRFIAANPEATRAFFAQLDVPVTGLDHSALAALARQSVGSSENSQQQDCAVVTQCLDLIEVLRESPAAVELVRKGFESWLIGSWVNQTQTNQLPLSEPRIKEALAGLAFHDVTKRGERFMPIVQSPLVVKNVVMPYEQRVIESTRSFCGPALYGWAAVANEYLATHKRLRYSDTDRTIMNGVFRTTSLYSDGDDWPVQRTAGILTEQLHAAYYDENSPLVEEPMSELVPASPAIMLSQIVAITGEIPEFVNNGHPKSAETATKLRDLDRLLAGEPVESIEGILGEVPVEALRKLITNPSILNGQVFLGQTTDGLRIALSDSSHFNPQVTTPVSGGFLAPTHRQPVDPLLLLAVLPDLVGESMERDSAIASLGKLDIAGTTFADHIRNLLASRLQSRRHAKRMLREMAAKTESPELLDMIKSIDPEAVQPVAEGGAEPISNEKD